jgi:flagellar biosynthesis protein FliQ
MLPADLFEIARQGLLLALVLSVPILGAAFAASLLTALLQTFTRVSDPVLTHVPRIAAVAIAAFASAPWVSSRLGQVAERVWSLIQIVNY